jgi:MinD superfamily P-loop ATPase
MTHQSSKVEQLIILSGKGGTGKTSLVAAFAHLSNNNDSNRQAVYVDADVDAANLSLVLHPGTKSIHEFWGGSLAEINPQECSGCGSCSEVCRYDAILPDIDHGSAYKVDPIACDGCAACVYACPQSAISMVQQQEGHWYQSTTPFGPLFHAELFPGKENSGKLVTLVKQQARLWANDNAYSHLVIDGPPGIGCPVISACAGTDLGLIVTEPGLSGLHDLKRVTGILKHFQIPIVICINKADIYPQGTKQIREFADEQSIEVIGEIPFDEHIPQSMLIGSPITDAFPNSPSALSIRSIWERTFLALFDYEEV